MEIAINISFSHYPFCFDGVIFLQPALGLWQWGCISIYIFVYTVEVAKETAIIGCVKVPNKAVLIALCHNVAVQEVVGSNHGRDMSFLGALVNDGDGLGRIST
jgi:hypothetical protein